MKMRLVMILSMVLLLQLLLTACATSGQSTAVQTTAVTTAQSISATTIQPTQATASTVQATTAAKQPTGSSWVIKIGSFDLTSSAVGSALKPVAKTLKKVSKDGTQKDQACTGYAMSSLLKIAGINQFTALTVVSADGSEYKLDSATALLETTMLVIEQNGEAYSVPRFAVDGKGSEAWLKDVISIKIT